MNDNNLSNKIELIKKAIDDYSGYSVQQRTLFKVMLDLSVDNLVAVTVKELVQLTKVSIPTVYSSLEKFKRDKLLTEDRDIGLNTYRINSVRVDEIIESFHKKEALKEKLQN